ncbi:MAG: monovalent cation/H(+) antiporter subunit G [Candidatus Acidiferrales bacterium]
MHHPTIAACLVGIAVALALACSLGVAVMRTALERLHFSAPLSSFGVALVACAVWIDDPSWQARLKVILIAIIMFLMNAILSHATARAIRIREEKHFEPEPSEEIPLVTKWRRDHRPPASGQ